MQKNLILKIKDKITNLNNLIIDYSGNNMFSIKMINKKDFTYLILFVHINSNYVIYSFYTENTVRTSNKKS